MDNLSTSLAHLSRATTVQTSGIERHYLNMAIEDIAKWRTMEGDAKANRRLATIAKITDIHLPYQNAAAIELAALLLEAHREAAPVDAITTGNDVFEFSNFSKFTDTRLGFMQAWDDDVNRVLEAYAALMRVWDDAAPEALRVWIPANHDWRLRDHLYSTTRSLAGYTYSHFLQDLRAQGTLYLTPQLDTGIYLHLNKRFTITHGNGGGNILNATMKMIEKFNYQRTVVFGHFHQYHVASRPSVDADGFRAEAHSVGCMCRLRPSYHAAAPLWQHGMAFVHYEVGDRAEVGYVENIPFDVDRRYLRAFFRGNEYRVKLPKSEQQRVGNQYA